MPVLILNIIFCHFYLVPKVKKFVKEKRQRKDKKKNTALPLHKLC